MFKIFSNVKRIVHVTQYVNLIADTIKWFHDTGVERGLIEPDKPKS